MGCNACYSPNTTYLVPHKHYTRSEKYVYCGKLVLDAYLEEPRGLVVLVEAIKGDIPLHGPVLRVTLFFFDDLALDTVRVEEEGGDDVEEDEGRHDEEDDEEQAH